MQRIHDVKKWKHVAAGGAMNFSDVRERRVRLDVNSAGPATLYYVDGNGETTLLALVHGRDVVEFQSHGETFAIAVEDNDIWAYTVDGDDVSFRIDEAVTFTKLVERRARNPEVEMMAYLMRENFRRLQEGQVRELEQLLDRRERAAAAAAAKSAPASDDAVGAAKSEPAKPANVDAGHKPGDDGDAPKAAS